MLNPLEVGFLSLTVIYSSIGYVVYSHEKSVPAFVLRMVKYGAFCYKGRDAKYMKKLELPKYYCRHFYTFACTFTIINLIYMALVYFCNCEVNVYYAKVLKSFHGSTSPVSVLASMTALCLLTLQCIRRCYETNCMQVFADSSKIYLTHYIAGWLFFVAVNVAIVGRAPLLRGENNRDTILWVDLKTIVALVLGIPVFLWAWYEQHQTNMILAKLRKDKKSGRMVTEQHRVPHGRLFESISSPHRFYEITLYAALLSILQTKTFFCIFLWVLFNQIQTSMLVHKWYKGTFKDYPNDRYAIFKGIL